MVPDQVPPVVGPPNAFPRNKPLLATVMGAVAGWVTVHSLQILTSESFRGFQDLRLATLFGGVVTGLLLVLVLGLSVILGRQTSLQEVILWHVVAAGISLLIALIVLQRKVSALPPREPLSLTKDRWLALVLEARRGVTPLGAPPNSLA